MLSPVGDHIPHEFNTLDLTDSKPTKLLDYPKKPLRGGGLRQINTCRKVPLYCRLIFLDDDILLWCSFKSLKNKFTTDFATIKSKYDQETLCVRSTILGIKDFCTNPLVTLLALYQRDANSLNTKSTIYVH